MMKKNINKKSSKKRNNKNTVESKQQELSPHGMSRLYIQQNFINKNAFAFGKPGYGKAFHPWDNLFNCPRCNSRHVWMENESGTYDDMSKLVRIRCLLCGKKTKYGELLEIRSIWSKGKDTWENANIAYPISNQSEENINLFIKLLKFISDFI